MVSRSPKDKSSFNPDDDDDAIMDPIALMQHLRNRESQLALVIGVRGVRLGVWGLGLGCGVWVVGCGAFYQLPGTLRHQLFLSCVDVCGRDADEEVRCSW